MTEQELREKMTIAIGQCYSQELSACPNHPIFQPQKAINLILDLVKEKYVRLADDQSRPKSTITYSDSFGDNLLRGQRNIAHKELIEAGWRKVEL